MATIEAIRRIKAELPGVHTVLGLSNVSFGLKPGGPPRRSTPCSCTSAREAGLDVGHRPRGADHAAQPHPRRAARGLPRPRSTTGATRADRATTRCRSCSSCSPTSRRRDGREGGPLATGPSSSACRSASSTATATASPPTSTRRWRRASRRSTIINDVLLAGMKVVGELFGSGQMQLPFVLQSAETMKAAGRLPRAAHGEGRGRQRARAASCSPP